MNGEKLLSLKATAWRWRQTHRTADARALADGAADLLAEIEQLRALTSECSCSGLPQPESPAADCPIHGAVRALNEVQAENETLRERLAEESAGKDLAWNTAKGLNARLEAAEAEVERLTQELSHARGRITDMLGGDTK